MSMGKKVGIGLTGLDVLVILYTERPGMMKMLRMGQGLSLLDFSQTLENHGGNHLILCPANIHIIGEGWGKHI